MVNLHLATRRHTTFYLVVPEVEGAPGAHHLVSPGKVMLLLHRLLLIRILHLMMIMMTILLVALLFFLALLLL